MNYDEHGQQKKNKKSLISMASAAKLGPLQKALQNPKHLYDNVDEASWLTAWPGLKMMLSHLWLGKRRS